MNYLKSVFQQNAEDWKLTIYVSFKYTRPRVDDLPIISDRTGLANDQIQRHIMESRKFISQSRKITMYRLTIIRCLVKTVRSPRCNWWWLGYTRIWLWIDCWHVLAPTCVSLPILCYFHGIISMVFSKLFERLLRILSLFTNRRIHIFRPQISLWTIAYK